MKQIKLFSILILTALITFMSSCKDKDEDPIAEAQTGTFNIEFNHIWGMGSVPFQMNTMIYHPKTKDSMEFTKVKYYISNVQLQKEDGTWWAEDESYYLVDLSETDGNILNIMNVPEGNYKALRFTHGVDSLRNFSGAQVGALSVLNGMFWSWNSGYIMIKLEGNSPQADDGTFRFHLGGYEEPNNVVTDKEFDFGSSNLIVSPTETHNVKVVVNPARAWHNAGTLTDMRDKIHMPGDTATMMAKDIFGFTAFESID
ncbi:MAG: hypothetical protein KJP21_08705 [Bacteroidia bacterium]|nr:hypothetical protein [Bacteroidia bacterium]NNJ56428.1 hypothetical protein [Bacteroidia bacterium]